METISSSEPPSTHHLDGIQACCQRMKTSLSEWRQDFYLLLRRKPFAEEEDLRAEILGAGLIMQAITCRLLGAVSPSDRASEEKEAVAHAKHMKRLIGSIAGTNQRATFYLEQKVMVADSILSTTEYWLEGPQSPNMPGGERLIGKSKLLAWLGIIPDDYGKAAVHQRLRGGDYTTASVIEPV
jgi:hypothetical protein